MGRMSELDIDLQDLREQFDMDEKSNTRMTFSQYLKQQAPLLFELTEGKKTGGKVKAMKNGGLTRKKRKIARGCGKVMDNRRKKTLFI